MSTAESVISRIGSDLFAILVPGTYVLISLSTFGITAYSCFVPSDPFNVVSEINAVASSKWTSALTIAMLAYLIGQVIHSYPVDRAQRTWAFILHRLRIEVDNSEQFPYYGTIRAQYDELCARNPLIPFIDLPTVEPPVQPIGAPVDQPQEQPKVYPFFNYWKLSVCCEEPPLYAIILHAEARVRLYAGVFWSGVFGILFAAISLAIAYVWEMSLAWVMLLELQFVLSLVFARMFGMQLRRVRELEVKAVFLSYLTVREKQAIAARIHADGLRFWRCHRP